MAHGQEIGDLFDVLVRIEEAILNMKAQVNSVSNNSIKVFCLSKAIEECRSGDEKDVLIVAREFEAYIREETP